MNIKYAFLAILMGASMLATTDSIAYSQIIDDEEEQESCVESYAGPCIAGGVIGGISGKISRVICGGSFTMTTIAVMSTENKAGQGIIGLAGLSVIIGTLVAENKLREKCIDWFNQQNECCGVKPSDLAKNSARIVSWITFLGIL